MGEKDFKKIVINGYIENEYSQNKDYLLTQYFISEAKKAKKDYFIKYEVFFQKCLEVIGSLEENIERQLRSRKEEIELGIKISNNQENIEIYKKELLNINRDWFQVPLHVFTNGMFMFGLQWREIQFIRKTIKDANNQLFNLDAVKISAPTIGLFCFLLNHSRLIPRGESENIEDFCQRICKRFNLDYTDRVRQTFNGSDTKKNRDKIVDLIIPLIDNDIRIGFTEYINNKYNHKQKLYV